MNKKQKTILLSILGTLLIIAIVVGTSYAFWRVTKVQEGEANTLSTACLGIDFVSISEHGIRLNSQFPITDDEGRKTQGYTFKITNNCDTYISYDINLESLNTVIEQERLNLNDLDTILDDGNVLGLGYYPLTESILEAKDGVAYDTRKLTTDTLGPSTGDNSSKEYTLRVWLDEDASAEVMNKKWNGKISVSTSPVIVENAITKLTELAKINTEEMFIDDTADANIRYMGKDPANYVDIGDSYYSEDLYYGYESEKEIWFPKEYTTLESCQKGINGPHNTTYKTNCTKIHSKGDPILWRIIGVMNNVDDGTGKKETRLKLIRDESLGNFIYTEACLNGNYNEENYSCITPDYNSKWLTSDLKNLLNNEYYNKKIGIPKTGYYPPDYDVIGQIIKNKPDFRNNGMTNRMKNLIKDTVYYLGGPFDESGEKNQFESWNVLDYYVGERNSLQVYEENEATWTGTVGLMYPSDYGYSTNGGKSGKEYCNTLKLRNWRNDECTNNSWIYHKNNSAWDIWTMSQYSSDISSVIFIDYEGYLDCSSTDYATATFPAVYLKPEVNIVSGDGTKENPYKLGI